jgi:hypothetical protein
MHLRLLLAAALTLSIAPRLEAQAGPATGAPDPSAAAVVAPAAAGVAATTRAARMQDEPGLRAQVARVFTGAVVGGWLGFFASQVAVSDWDKASNPAVSQNRGYWAAGGLVAGAVVGRLLQPGSGPPDIDLDMTRGRAIISKDDIIKSGATNAQELIRSLRAEWLVPRGVNSWRESARGSAAGLNPTVNVVPGDDHILVYLDNSRVGGTQHLAEITLANVERIEFVDAAAATFRWGSGHAHGVILIVTQPPMFGR